LQRVVKQENCWPWGKLSWWLQSIFKWFQEENIYM
jgi:hypothetical protein